MRKGVESSKLWQPRTSGKFAQQKREIRHAIPVLGQWKLIGAGPVCKICFWGSISLSATAESFSLQPFCHLKVLSFQTQP